MLEGDARAVAVVNLFPNKIDALPRSMADVGQHCLNLLFANKTKSDVALMKRFDAVADLMAELETALPADSPLRDLPSFKAAAAYKRIPTIVEITRTRPAEQLEASDFRTPASRVVPARAACWRARRWRQRGFCRRAREGGNGQAYTQTVPVNLAITSPTGSISRSPVLRVFTSTMSSARPFGPTIT